MMIFDPLDRNLADVQRWGIVRTIRKQSVAEHSYYVALWTEPLMRKLGVTDPERILAAVRYALLHDKPEVVSGDVPSPLKQRLPKGIIDDACKSSMDIPKPPDDLTALVVKTLDLFEALTFIVEDEALGNTRLKDLYQTLRAKLMYSAVELQSVAGMRSYGDWLPDMFSAALNKIGGAIVDPFE